MYRSTKAALRTAAFTPVAVMLAMAAGPALAANGAAAGPALATHGGAAGPSHAGMKAPAGATGPGRAAAKPHGVPGVPGVDGINGPLAAAVNGPLKSVAGRLPVQTATLAHPTTLLPGAPNTSTDGLLSLAGGELAVSHPKSNAAAQQALAHLGKGTLLDRSGAFRTLTFSGVTARCVTSTDGSIQGTTTIDHGKLVGGALDKVGSLTKNGAQLQNLPALPPANFRVPIADPRTHLTLNKQVPDAVGGMTVSAISVDGAAGTARDLGIAHCAPLNERLAQRGDPAPVGGLPDQIAGLFGPIQPQVAPVLGGLTGANSLAAPKGPGGPLAALPGGAQSLLLNPIAGLPGVSDVKKALPEGIGDAKSGLPGGAQFTSLSGLFGGLPGLPGTLPDTGSMNG